MTFSKSTTSHLDVIINDISSRCHHQHQHYLISMTLSTTSSSHINILINNNIISKSHSSCTYIYSSCLRFTLPMSSHFDCWDLKNNNFLTSCDIFQLERELLSARIIVLSANPNPRRICAQREQSSQHQKWILAQQNLQIINMFFSMKNTIFTSLS